MTDTITVTVPLTYDALRSTATYFDGLARPYKNSKTPTVAPEPEQERIETTIAPTPAAAPAPTPAPAAAPAPTPAPAAAPAPTPAPAAAETLASPDGVEVDSTGLPWDVRINASTKTKRVGDDTWKLIRGVDAEYVETVKAELKALMAIPAPAPVAPAPVAPAPVAPAPVAPAPAPAAPVAAGTMTFAWLMAGITGKGISNDVVLTAVNNAGFQSLQLVAARQDLIPQIAKELGL